jgi:hypothetical protein
MERQEILSPDADMNLVFFDKPKKNFQNNLTGAGVLIFLG